MALPYDTTLLINVLRESAISIQNNSTNSDIKSSRIESILGSFYNSHSLEQSIDLNSHFPIISRTSQQNSPPIQSNVLSYKNRYKTDKDSNFLDSIKNPEPRHNSAASAILGQQSIRRQSDTSLKIISSKSRRHESISSIPESTISTTSSISTARGSIQPPSSPTSSLPPPTQNKSAAKVTPFSKISNLIRQRHVSNPNTIDEENESSDASLTISSRDSNRESNGSSALEIAKARIPSFIMQRTQSELSSESNDIGLESDDEGEDLSTDNFRKSQSIDSDQLIDDDDDYIPESLRYSDDDDDDEFQNGFDSDDYLDDSDYLIEDSLGASSSSALNMFRSQTDTDTNSISKISFTRARNNSSAFSLKLGKTGAAAVSLKLKNNVGPFSLQSFSNNLPPLPPPPSHLPSTSYQTTTKFKQALKRNSKSFSSILDGNPLVEQTLDFSKKEVKPINSDVKKPEKSNLTSAIKKLDGGNPDGKLTLEYFEYAKHQQTATDKIINVLVSLPSLKIFSLDLKANGSVTVFELIGYVLLTIKSRGLITLTELQQNPNHWIIYLADEDGEVEDDFGVLDRTREFQSYGADEFVLVECSESEMEKNESITPYSLQQSNEIEDYNESSLKDFPQRQLTIGRSHHGKALSLATAPGGGLTPSSGVTLSSQFQRQNSVRAPAETTFSDYDSDEETSNSDNARLLRLMKKSYATNTSPAMTGTSVSTLKDSKLNRFKNSKTFQTLLHASANYYQQQHNMMLQQQLNQVDGNRLPDLTSYHRWTVWRRQQMSFKTKHPKSLVVDGWQIYILPFNEINGSWSESKTSSFNISQVLKVKQSTKVPKYFKIIINKNYENTDAVLKKYYLESKTNQECKEIVDTVKGLMTAYHRDQLHGSIM